MDVIIDTSKLFFFSNIINLEVLHEISCAAHCLLIIKNIIQINTYKTTMTYDMALNFNN
jgi:hypothetical protein